MLTNVSVVPPALHIGAAPRLRAPCYGISLEQMALNNKIGPLYQDTEEFVAELGNYLKLAKTCDNDKLSDCFGYEEFTDATGKTISFEDMENGSGFNMPKSDTSDFTGNTKGIVTIDGTPMILAWNKKCEILEPGVYEWSGNTNVSTKCVAAMMDVNGTKRPDRLGRDIILLNASNLGVCIKFTVNGTTYKWGCPFEPTPLTYTQCQQMVTEGKIQYCADENKILSVYENGSYVDKHFWMDYGGDRWASTVQACGGKNNMPTMAELGALATYLYDRESNPIRAIQTVSSDISINTAKLSGLNTTLSNSSSFTIWSGEEDNETSARLRSFSKKHTSDYSLYKNKIGCFGICKL